MSINNIYSSLQATLHGWADIIGIIIIQTIICISVLDVLTHISYSGKCVIIRAWLVIVINPFNPVGTYVPPLKNIFKGCNIYSYFS